MLSFFLLSLALLDQVYYRELRYVSSVHFWPAYDRHKGRARVETTSKEEGKELYLHKFRIIRNRE